jgi:thiamine biosynthesis lipoprotein ApbE
MTGSEVVYAVHKFEAENVDEISINVGEQVIVLEKDDGYNDGWWQVLSEAPLYTRTRVLIIIVVYRAVTSRDK